jgi:hypothetical protein
MNLSFITDQNPTGAEGDVVAYVHKTVGQVGARLNGHVRPWYQQYYHAHLGYWDASLLPLNDLTSFAADFGCENYVRKCPGLHKLSSY